MFCTKCGKPNAPGAAFCSSCGNAMATGGAVGAPPPPPAARMSGLGKHGRRVVIVLAIAGVVFGLFGPIIAIAILAILGQKARNVFVQVNTRYTSTD